MWQVMLCPCQCHAPCHLRAAEGHRLFTVSPREDPPKCRLPLPWWCNSPNSSPTPRPRPRNDTTPTDPAYPCPIHPVSSVLRPAGPPHPSVPHSRIRRRTCLPDGTPSRYWTRISRAGKWYDWQGSRGERPEVRGVSGPSIDRLWRIRLRHIWDCSRGTRRTPRRMPRMSTERELWRKLWDLWTKMFSFFTFFILFSLIFFYFITKYIKTNIYCSKNKWVSIATHCWD